MDKAKIQRLPTHVINQIKAGEVVERPLNVVKELVENALDAQATFITVELIDGGKQLIRVTDNGCGMSPEDLVLAIERHATSKIRSVEDLLTLHSLGFRGEALPSIAAVSDFLIRSRSVDFATGYEITVKESIASEPYAVAMPVGTVVTVRDLFGNIPARRKFLKSTATEFSHIYDFMFAMSLAYPHVAFRLVHNGRESLFLTASDSLESRFQALLRTEASEFAPLFFQRGSFVLQGWVMRPEFAKNVPRYFVTIVNGRMVRDKVVRNAILQGYYGILSKEFVPSVLLLLSIPSDWIDVNAHPAKVEVRFFDPELITELIAEGIAQSLKKAAGEKTPFIQDSSCKLSEENLEKKADFVSKTWQASASQDSITFYSANLFSNSKPFVQTSSLQERVSSAGHQFPIVRQNAEQELKQAQNLIENKDFSPKSRLFEVSEKEERLAKFKYLGQFQRSYLLAEIDEELWIIDQHALHERILYEEFSLQLKERGVAYQELLAPILVPLPEALVDIVIHYGDVLQKLGIIVEKFSDGIALHSTPLLVHPSRLTELFDDLVVRLLVCEGVPVTEVHPLVLRAQHFTPSDTLSTSLNPEKVFHLSLASLACHAAVRAGDELTSEEAMQLIRRILDVDFFAYCPHGRPAFRCFQKSDIASWFLRV